MLQQFRSRFLPLAIWVMGFFFAAPLLAIPNPVSVLLQINRLAGSPTAALGDSGDNGPALNSLLSQPESVTVDGAGNLYIADTANDCIRRIDVTTGILTTVAGTPGQQGYGGDNGPATAAKLNQPAAVLADAYGHLYIADTGNSVIRKITIATGIISTVAGNRTAGYSGDAGLATQAELNLPTALAVNASGNLFIADTANNRVRRVDSITGIITLFAGDGSAAYNGDGIPATLASLSAPQGIAIDSSGYVYISDTGHSLVRKIVSGNIQIVAGMAGTAGYSGDGGSAISAALDLPTGLALTGNGNLYISDSGNARIRGVSAGTITTLAGNGTAGLLGDGEPASTAEINAPGGLALDPDGNLYLADSGNNQVRLISNGANFPAMPIVIVPAAHSIFLRLNQSATLSLSAIPAGENGLQEFSMSSVAGCVSDGITLNTAGSICTIPIHFNPGFPGVRTGTLRFASNGIPYSLGLNGVGLGPEAVMVPGIIQTIMDSGDLVNNVSLQTPAQAAVDMAGNLYLADPGSNRIWMLNAVSGAVSVVAGGGNDPSDGVLAVNAVLNLPSSVALDAAGNLYIGETGANRVRQVNLASGMITTVAGTGTPGFSGDNGPATSAELSGPVGVAANAAGDLFIADTGNNRIRRVFAGSGIIVTVAGSGTAGYSGDQGFATLAELNSPQSVALDPAGRLFIADTANNVVRSVDPETGLITTVAGNGSAAFSGDLGAATAASLNLPVSVAVDAADNIYIADSGNARVRKVYAQSGTIVTIAGSALVGDEGDGHSAAAAALDQPSGVVLDSIGQILIADHGNDSVRIVSSAADTLNFGAQPVGSTTSAQTDFLSNIGNQPLAISQFTAPTDFPLAQDAAQCAPGNLDAGSLCDLGFVFHPTASGSLGEEGKITDNALNVPGAQQDISLTGNGLGVPTIATTTIVSVSPSTAVYGAPVTLTATVAGGNGPVHGSVLFFINGGEVGGAQLIGLGMASVSLPAPPAGTDVVTATFAGPGYAASTSLQVPLTVTPANSQIALSSSTQQTRQGQDVIFTANVVSTTTGIPTGFVEFLNGSAESQESPLNATGQAILDTTFLPAGADTITARYLGDGNFQQSTSSSVTVTVANDALTLVASPTTLTIEPGKTGQTVVTLTPKNGFAGNISLSCAGLVQGTTCQFNAPTITFNAQTQTAQTATLTINPNTLASAGVGIIPGSGRMLPRLLLLLLGFGATLLLFRARKQSAKLGLARALLVLFCLGICTLTGCANLVPHQPVQAAVTVQASMPGSGVIATAQLQVYMQQ